MTNLNKYKFRESNFEKQYVAMLQNLMLSGEESGDRTGVGTTRFQSDNIHYSEFPALIGKKVNPQSALTEMIWIMLGRTDIAFLKEHGVNYWDSWVKEDGTFGPIYGEQMRNFLGIDQLVNNLNELRTNPDSRRIITSLWNPTNLSEQALAPCHCFYHFTSYIKNDFRFIDLHVTQRSADIFLGVPYDLMLFKIYLDIVSWFLGYISHEVHTTFNDLHKYLNHDEACKQYLKQYINDEDSLIKNRKPLDVNLPPALVHEGEFTKEFVNEKLMWILENKYFIPTNYKSYKFIKAEVAV